ncbi:MAG: heme a synthase [Pseudonocardiales bacterium]|nr:heme a synthase [Pseudonocardiales bacterium]
MVAGGGSGAPPAGHAYDRRVARPSVPPPLPDRRTPAPPTALRRLAVATVVAQAGIAVTGSIVRVTGSGLGCPTWPQCFPGSLVPTPHPEVAALHQWVEFGNRLLTGVVVLVTGLCLIAALRTRRLGHSRAGLVRLALVQPLGVVAQAVLGGFTVLLGLAWWSVSAHFLVSMVLVWLAVQLVHAADEGEGDGPPRAPVAPAIRGLVVTSTVLLALLLTAGTFVTAAGPHSGDADTPRLAPGVPATAQLHADLLFGYLGLLVGLGFALHVVAPPPTVLRRYRLLVAAVLAQGVLGGVQYALGVPEALVSLHVLGAALVTVAAAALWAAVTVPGGHPPVLPGPPRAGADEPALAERS